MDFPFALVPIAHLSLSPRWSLPIGSAVVVDPGLDRSGTLSAADIHGPNILMRSIAV